MTLRHSRSAIRRLLVLPLLAGLAVSAVPARPTAAASLHFADPAFLQVWTRTDGPVAGRQALRSWYWGPAPGAVVREPFAGLPGGGHLVQYFDKSRMEVNDPGADRQSPWFVTNGLLAIELISGQIQTGPAAYERRAPATIPLASDTDDTTAPTYASFLPVSNTARGDHPAPDRSGADVIATLDRAGQPGQDASRALAATRLAHFEPRTHHNIPGVFWSFLNSSGPVDNGGLHPAPLATPWNFVAGLPISEAYWARVKIAGAPQWVLIQAFERRVLTFVPANAAAWQVQMGNIGQHYFAWRYGGPAVTLQNAVAALAAAPSYHFTSLLQLQSGHLLIPFIRQGGDFQAPDRTHFVQQGTTGSNEIITLGPRMYASGALTGGHWQQVDPATSPAVDLLGLIGVLQYATNVTSAPDEAVNGTPSRHLHMTLDPATLPSMPGVRYSAAEGDVYLAADSGRISRETSLITLAPGSGQQGYVLAVVDFTQYGAAVRIEAPLP